MKPIVNHIGVCNWIVPPHIVASQENILIAVGTAILWIVNSFD